LSKLFDHTEINGMTLKNRFVRSATWEGMAAEDGACTPKLVDTIARLAGGGVGLIITGHAYVLKQGQAGEWQLGIYEDSLIPGLREMTDVVHQKGGRIVAQLAHPACLPIRRSPVIRRWHLLRSAALRSRLFRRWPSQTFRM